MLLAFYSVRGENITKVHLHKIPMLASICIGVFLGLVLSAVFIEKRAASLHEQLMQNYGSALATMAANRAIDATLNHDLVSLQVILQDVVSNEQVFLATIHDVENNLLVQAGEERPSVDSTVFVAAIPLHDSIAGYVTVNLVYLTDAKASLVLYGVVGFSVLLLIVAMLAIFDAREAIFEHIEPTTTPDPQGAVLPLVDYPFVEEAQPDSGSVFNYTYFEIRILNIDTLRKQLGADLLQSVYARLEWSINQVVGLYGGLSSCPTEQAKAQGIYIGTFQSNISLPQTYFNTLCAMYLVASVAKYKKFKVDLGLLVSTKMLSEGQRLHPGKVIMAGLDPDIEDFIATRVRYIDEEDEVSLLGFHDNVQTLLTSQEQQLFEELSLSTASF